MSDPLFPSLSARLSMSKGGREGGTSDRIDGPRKFYTSTPFALGTRVASPGWLIQPKDTWRHQISMKLSG